MTDFHWIARVAKTNKYSATEKYLKYTLRLSKTE